jgi:hypothetical protein
MNMGDALYLLITDEAMRRWHPAVGSRAGALICCGKTVKRAVIHVMHEMRERANAHQPFVNCHLRSDAEPAVIIRPTVATILGNECNFFFR